MLAEVPPLLLWSTCWYFYAVGSPCSREGEAGKISRAHPGPGVRWRCIGLGAIMLLTIYYVRLWALQISSVLAGSMGYSLKDGGLTSHSSLLHGGSKVWGCVVSSYFQQGGLKKAPRGRGRSRTGLEVRETLCCAGNWLATGCLADKA